jgi:hypothetical protein
MVTPCRVLGYNEAAGNLVRGILANRRARMDRCARPGERAGDLVATMAMRVGWASG